MTSKYAACLVGGIVILIVTTWWRQPPRHPGSTRWWTGLDYNVHAVLIGLPGIGLSLISIWPLATYDGDTASITGESWKAWAFLPMVIGLVMAMWAALALPIPSWVKPRWLQERERILRERERAREEREQNQGKGA